MGLTWDQGFSVCYQLFERTSSHPHGVGGEPGLRLVELARSHSFYAVVGSLSNLPRRTLASRSPALLVSYFVYCADIRGSYSVLSLTRDQFLRSQIFPQAELFLPPTSLGIFNIVSSPYAILSAVTGSLRHRFTRVGRLLNIWGILVRCLLLITKLILLRPEDILGWISITQQWLSCFMV